MKISNYLLPSKIGQLSCFILITLVLSCKTAKFPIYKKLSDTKPSSIAGIGKTLFDECQKRHIQITILSTNIAEFKGSLRQMRWLQKNYHILICDFDQDTSLLGAPDYTQCITYSEYWIKVIQSGNPQLLMPTDSDSYCHTCMVNKVCY